MLLGAASPTGRLEVEVAGLRSAAGTLRLCLTADPRAFPACHADPRAARVNVPAGTARLVVEGLPPGDYAAALLHDANGNKRLDKLAGIPTEGFGFSRNPAIRFGPPLFSAARFPVAAGASTQRVRMRYML